MVTLHDECLILPARAVTRAAESAVERMQARLDEAADAAYERRVNAEEAVTYDELMEEMDSISDAAKAEFMANLARGDRVSCSCLFVELSRAKDRVVARLLVEER